MDNVGGAETTALISMRAYWWRRARETAPLTPHWFSHALSRLLACRAMSSDALLILGDALAESGSVAAFEGQENLAEQLRRLADLPRELAPRRAEQGD